MTKYGKICEGCGKIFYVREARLNEARYCSKFCYHENQEGVDQHADEPWADPARLREMLINQNMTQREVANELGCCQQTISRRCKKYGIETRGRGRREEHVTFNPANSNGYEVWSVRTGKDRGKAVYVHRLLAVAEFGLDALKDGPMEVHHKNRIPWDNRPDNIEVINQSEHARIHFGHSESATGGEA